MCTKEAPVQLVSTELVPRVGNSARISVYDVGKSSSLSGGNRALLGPQIAWRRSAWALGQPLGVIRHLDLIY